MPIAGAVHVVEYCAVDTPDDVPIKPGPVMPVGMVQALSEYRVKNTEPLGGTDVVLPKVALSPTMSVDPTVVVAGVAWVTIVGDPGPTTISSLASLQPVVKGLLFASPA